MYDLSDKFSNTFDVIAYTVSAMRETGFNQSDIDDYLIDATSTHNSHLVDVSIEVIDKCNNRINAYNDDSLNDKYFDYLDSNCKYYWEEEEDSYEGFSDNYNKEYDNDDDEYEGFDHANRYSTYY